MRYAFGNSALFLLFVASILSGCGESSRKAARGGEAAVDRGPVLRYAIQNDISNMDPAQITDIESALVASQVYEGLVRFKRDNVEIEPALAESWTTSDDGLTWTFKMRPDVKFQDGEPVDAHAVVYSVKRQMDENHPGHVPGRMRYAKLLFGDPASTESQLVKDVVANGDMEVVFHLARPHTPFLKNLAMTPASVVSPKSVELLKADFNTTMVGSGAFRLKSYLRDQVVELERNPDFRGDATAVAGVQFQVLRNENTRINSIRKGDVDVAAGIEPTALEMLRNEANLKILSEPSMNLGYIALNNANPPFDNPKVRLAICYAIDRTFISETLFSGTSVNATGIIPPGMLGYDESRPGFPYNPEKAKQLLAEAGYPDGFDVTFNTHNSPRIYSPVGVKLAERIQQDLGKVGIRVKLDQMEFSTFLARQKSKDYQMSNSGWVSDNGDPDNFIYELAGREDNDTNYSNPEATKLMRDAAAESDEAKRGEMYKQANAMLAENPPFVPINHAKQIIAVRDTVTNFSLHPTGVNDLRRVSLEGSESR